MNRWIAWEAAEISAANHHGWPQNVYNAPNQKKRNCFKLQTEQRFEVYSCIPANQRKGSCFKLQIQKRFKIYSCRLQQSCFKLQIEKRFKVYSCRLQTIWNCRSKTDLRFTAVDCSKPIRNFKLHIEKRFKVNMPANQKKEGVLNCRSRRDLRFIHASKPKKRKVF